MCQVASISPHSNSVVDYFIVSESIFKNMSSMNIIDCILSWHLPLILTLSCKNSLEVDTNLNDSTDPFSYIKWDKNRAEEFLNYIESHSCKQKTYQAVEEIGQDPIRALDLFTDMLHTYPIYKRTS